MQVWGKDIISTFIYFTAGLALLMAVQKLVPVKRRIENYLIFILYVTLAIILFSLGNVLTERERELPVCIFMLITAFSLIGPLTVLYTHALIYPETPKSRYLKYHFIFPLVLFGGEFIFYFLQSLKTQQEAIAAFLGNRLGHPFAIPILLVTATSTAYFFFRYRVLFQVFDVREIRKQIVFILVLASISATALYSVVFGFLFGVDLVFAAALFNQLLPDATANYFAQTARVLKPGGRAMFSFFLLDNLRPRQSRPFGFSRPMFDFAHTLPQWGDGFAVGVAEHPTAMTGYRLSLIKQMAEQAGLELEQPPLPGLWSGQFANWVCAEDVVVLRKQT